MLTELVYRNPEATMPLRISLQVACNTPDDKILANMRHNAAGRAGWVKLEPPHEGVALICGSGPSLSDTLPQLRDMVAAGGKVFALNGAAKFLHEHGIAVDEQVIMDAQPRTAELVFPGARHHLFASQVDPECFERAPAAQLWHATHGEIAPEFPEYEDDYCMVGGAVSVGNAALVLTYILGYRTLHCFGFDSSHRGGAGHAFRQPMNDGEPCTEVQFRGKTYIASLTMNLQAQYFMERSRALREQGCSIEVHGSGLLPDMYNAPPLDEREKYEEIWKDRRYGDISPGLQNVATFIERCRPWGTVVDVGCGSGKGGAEIARRTGCKVILADFARNCLDPDIRLPFVQFDLRARVCVAPRGDWAFCCDVMEHIPPESVDRALRNVMAVAPRAYFQISLVPDVWGDTIGQPLHLSVHPSSWWREKFDQLGFTVHWTEESGQEARFFVTA